MPKFKTIYDTTHDRVHPQIDDVSMTDPSFRDECDISLMIENYRVRRIPLPQVNVQYGYSPTVEQFSEAQQMVAELKTQFESLPSHERDEFGTIQNYLRFIGNPDNLKASYERGLIDPSSVDLLDVYPERFAKVEKVEKVENNERQTPLEPQPKTSPELG